MNSKYTLTGALEFAKKSSIGEWLHAFLLDEGNNIAFSVGLKKEKRYYIGPVKMPLYLFERCCGPELSMKYKIDESGFNMRVAAIAKRFKNSWDMPPLIINYCDGKFELNDGNHRYEALKNCGIKECYVIIWITDNNDYTDFTDKYRRYISDC